MSKPEKSEPTVVKPAPLSTATLVIAFILTIPWLLLALAFVAAVVAGGS